MNAAAHPLLNPQSAPAVDANGGRIDYEQGRVVIDATPLYLFGIVIASAAVLAGLKFAGFKFVIGVGK